MNETSNLENKLFWFLRKLTDCVVTSFLWLLCCIPVVTIGASTAALYGTVHSVIRHDRDTAASNFWRVFKTYFAKATIVWMIMLLGLAVFSFGWFLTYGAMMSGSEMGIFNPLFLIPIVYLLAVGIYVFPYLVRFQTDVKHIMKNAATIAVLNLHWTVLLLILPILALLSMIAMPVLIFVSPAVACLVKEIILEKIFRKLMRPEDLQKELDREKREKQESSSGSLN